MATAYQAVNVCSMRYDQYYNDGTGWGSVSWRWCPNITDDIRQGTYNYTTVVGGDDEEHWIDYYGVMMFDNDALIAKYATHSISSAQLKVTRTGSGGTSSSKIATLYAGNQTDMPALESTSASVKAVPSAVTSGYNYTITAGADEKTLDLNTALVESLCTGASDCLYFYVGRSTSKYMSFEGRDDLTTVVLEVTWDARDIPVKAYDGATWQQGTKMQVYDGAAWHEATAVKVYDGATWQTVY